MIDLSLLQDFIAETGEHLEEMETKLLKLESEPENRDFLNDIFRSIHTIKGSSEYLGMERIANLSHKLENLLDMLRQGELLPDKDIIDALIEAKDRIILLTADLEESRSEKTDVEDIIEKISQLSTDKRSEKDEDDQSDGQIEERLNNLADDLAESLEKDSSDDDGAVYQEDEAYYEEFDEELFGIFIQQLKEKLFDLLSYADELQNSDKKNQVLDKLLDCINSLKSSANYMGYEKLVSIYKNWCNEVIKVQNELSWENDLSFNDFVNSYIKTYIDKILRFFPQVKEFEAEINKKMSDCLSHCESEEKPVKTEYPSDKPLEDSDESLSFPEMSVVDDADLNLFQDEEEEDESSAGKVAPPADLDDRKLFNELDRAFDSFDDEPEKLESGSFSGEDDRKLFNRLDSAFDSFADEHEELESESLPENMEDVLFSNSNEEPKNSEVFESEEAVAEKREDKSKLNAVSASVEERDVAKDMSGNKSAAAEISSEKIIKHSMRVDAKKIDSLINQVGELVVSRAWFSQLSNEMRHLQEYLKKTGKLDQKEMKHVKNHTFRLNEANIALGRVANELQEGVMKIRMLPIEQLFKRYPRLVRDLTKDTDKKVQLEIRGEDTELDKMIIEEISDPLIHIIRNAVDHGIETADKRKSLGKPETGKLMLEAYHESNHVVIEITDDGKGIDPAFIKAAVLKRKLLSEEEMNRMTSRELLGLIMIPGFSTSDRVTHTSGRGVGMDVVKKNIEKLNGNIEIDSIAGTKTCFRIKIPLTLAIIPALLVRIESDLFTVPLAVVEETLWIYKEEATMIEGVEVINLRDSTLPLVRLAELFNINTAEAQESDRAFVVVVNSGVKRVGLMVDALIGQEDVVIKPLVDYLQENSGFSGATIMGDGRISLILDVSEIVDMTIGRQAERRCQAA